jgi:hypothetical protein
MGLRLGNIANNYCIRKTYNLLLSSRILFTDKLMLRYRINTKAKENSGETLNYLLKYLILQKECGLNLISS